jgi:hypothetical protein
MKRKFRLANRLISSVLIVFIFICHVMAQNVEIKEANPADVGSIDAVVKALYEVISGDAGQERDWNRFRTLFYQDARMIPAGKNAQTGLVAARALSPEDYIKRTEPIFAKQGFFERERARRVEVYGSIAHVFSTYESFHSRTDKKPFVRGINSFQLLNDGKRWWVLSVYWQNETPDAPLPKKYLKTVKSD